MLLFILIPDEQEKALLPAITIREDLIVRIAHNDMAALETLYHLSSHAVYGFVLSILKNQYDAEDILQDTYIKIKTGAHLYQPQGKPFAWILTIAKNLAYMKLRKESIYTSSDYAELENTLDFSTIENHEDKLILEAAFSILNDQERQIIILHANTGMKHKEIAILLNLPLSTILSKYHRGLKKLKNYIEKSEV